MAPMGRPMKYDVFLECLDPRKVYIPATIVKCGEEEGLFEENSDPDALDLAKVRVRHALARFSASHRFPMEGDGMVHLHGQPPIRGWYGWRWQEPLKFKRKR